MIQFQKNNENSTLSGVIRSCPEDFQVDEIQQFTPSGKGEHVWLHIQKTGENTDWVAGLLAKIAEVPRKDVSYAGLKDRNAVTTQWFSVQMPGREAPDWQTQLPKSIKVLEEKRHDRKLKRGALEGNSFKLIIREFEGEEAELKESVEHIKEQGIPNYFGEQRFGFYDETHNCGSNIRKAEQWFKGEFKVKSRPKRSIYLSAARSWIFNYILSERVKQGTWNQAVEGDVFMINHSKSCFYEEVDKEIIARIDKKELHPTGVLWGRGRSLTKGAAAALEKEVSERFSILCEGLERNGLKQERKALRLNVDDLAYTYKRSDNLSTVTLEFTLPAGAYATAVLAEIGHFK